MHLLVPVSYLSWRTIRDTAGDSTELEILSSGIQVTIRSSSPNHAVRLGSKFPLRPTLLRLISSGTPARSHLSRTSRDLARSSRQPVCTYPSRRLACPREFVRQEEHFARIQEALRDSDSTPARRRSSDDDAFCRSPGFSSSQLLGLKMRIRWQESRRTTSFLPDRDIVCSCAAQHDLARSALVIANFRRCRFRETEGSALVVHNRSSRTPPRSWSRFTLHSASSFSSLSSFLAPALFPSARSRRPPLSIRLAQPSLLCSNGSSPWLKESCPHSRRFLFPRTPDSCITMYCSVVLTSEDSSHNTSKFAAEVVQ